VAVVISISFMPPKRVGNFVVTEMLEPLNTSITLKITAVPATEQPSELGNLIEMFTLLISPDYTLNECND